MGRSISNVVVGEAEVISKAIQTDCIAGLDGLEKGSMAAIITSPPYNIGKKVSRV